MLILAGCASKDLNYEPKSVISDYNASWQSKFTSIPQLSSFIRSAMVNNEDLGVAALNLSQAMSRAKISKQDFFPTFGASSGASSSRNIDIKDSWNKGFNSAFKLSYELDIYGKIYDAYESKGWSALSSALSLEDLRQSIVNSVIDEYFHILFLNDKIINLEQNLQNLRSLNELVETKFRLGKEEIASLRQSEQNLLKIENELLDSKSDLQTSYEVLKNLTRSDETIYGGILEFDLNSLKSGVNSLKILSDKVKSRPDVNSALAALNAGFYDYKVAQKNFYPSISLGGSLKDSDVRLSDSFGFNILAGSVEISLPFLDYSRLKSELKISEDEFNKLRLNYEKTLNNAVNEALKYANLAQIDEKSYENLRIVEAKSAQISQIYETKYKAGRVGLKDLLETKNDLISARNSLLAKKYSLISDKISFLRASASE